jgi:transposase-like protein
MPAHKKKATTSTSPQATSTITSAEPLTPQTFHQYLRAEIRQAIRAVMEEIMLEELSHFLQAEWGESTPERKSYRNGFYSRDLMTTSGPIKDLTVPRDREGAFHTQAFEQYRRYEPQVARSD